MKSTWDKSLETGNKTIDAQHRKLIHFVDQLDETKFTDKDALSLLDKLIDFTNLHFLSEEKLMKEAQYPPNLTKEMTDHHHGFKNFLRFSVLEFRKKAFDIIPFQQLVGTFLKEHEFGLDRKLVNWIHQRDAA